MKRILVLLMFAGVPFAQQPKPARVPTAKPAVKSQAPRNKPVASVAPTPVSAPSFTGGPALDDVISTAIREKQIPGAVVLVGHKGRVVYHKAYGFRALVPRREAMTLNTIFDVASLTKVVGTTSGIMKLLEQGKLRLSDKVTEYLPEFQGGKSDITVRNLLTHYSGMRPDVDLEPEWSGYETGIQKALIDVPTAPPGVKFTYSDINFLLLGEIVHRLSGKPLHEFVRNEVFAPLGMNDTGWLPSPKLRGRIAPTEYVKGSAQLLRGTVHDPTARFMGGVAGHAGVFSTAWDLSKFAEMMLGYGERNGVRIFSPLTVQAFTTPQSPPERLAVRGLGWDIDSSFSSSRGDLFPVGSYGHTGFTGTSMWLDPNTRSYVILLTNSVHPKLRPSITPLRSRVATAAAAGLQIDEPPVLVTSARPNTTALPRRAEPGGPVLTGIDVLAAEGFASLKGKRIGLITNHTGLTREGKRNIDAMLAAGVDLKALYSPEHGISGREDQENIGHGRDDATGLPVWSLYSGQNRRPASEMLLGIDALVFDIQDIGARFYTYICTMKNAMEEAAARGIPFVVLDRPNPITGLHVEGPMLEAGLESFVGCFALPVRHGMTTGEIAGMMNAAMPKKAELTVVKMQGWNRSDWFDSAGLPWVNPSPNMRSLNAALLYPGIGMLEYGTVYSVGRGTDAPFEQVGADWMNGRELALYLNGRNIPGIRVYPTVLRPSASNFAGKTIEGIRFVITDRDAFDSVKFGIELGAAISKLFPGKMNWQVNANLTGSRALLNGLEAGEEPARIEAQFAAGTEAFRVRRAEFLLYR
jgi:uncharacterized protein YbbC (DUF1343 family)/CubicO group peptidase (beta-lactamase class C family)